MKLLQQVKEIIDRYDLKPLESKGAVVNHPTKDDSYFIEKYDKFIPKGWYGFAIGTPTPKEWMDLLDEILSLLTSHDPDFQIHQIKTKFGGIRFYVASREIEDLDDIEDLIEDTLFDEVLIY
jgi:hypothetical protein